ncbi:hypothetical protein Tco_1282899 [Tanacetum coccineum]
MLTRSSSTFLALVDQYLANRSGSSVLHVQFEGGNQDIQRQLYQSLVDSYEADKILLDTYGDKVTIKRPRDGADDDQEPSAGTDQGSKRRRPGVETGVLRCTSRRRGPTSS